MRCRYLLLIPLALAPFTTPSTPAFAQAPGPAQPAAPPAPHATADAVLARIMAFDRNRDGLVAKDELLDRMQHVISRADANHDGALDGIEIHAFAANPPAEPVRQVFPSGSYGFADETTFSSRSHIEGAIDDLRLAAPARQQALATSMSFVDALEKGAAAELLNEVDDLLSEEQLAAFVEVVNQHENMPIAVVNGPHGKAIRINGPRPGLRFLIERYGLSPGEKRRALDAIARFEERLRLDDAHRSQLLDRLATVLSGEERDNLRAALERRPVVKNGGLADVVFKLQQLTGGKPDVIVDGGQFRFQKPVFIMPAQAPAAVAP